VKKTLRYIAMTLLLLGSMAMPSLTMADGGEIPPQCMPCDQPPF